MQRWRRLPPKGPDILAHIDLIKKLNGEGEFFDEEAPRYRAAALKALSAAKEHNCLLEVNTGGVYRGYRKDFYPSAWMLEEWNKMGGKVIITSDSHDVSSLTSALRKPPPPSRQLVSPAWRC